MDPPGRARAPRRGPTPVPAGPRSAGGTRHSRSGAPRAALPAGEETDEPVGAPAGGCLSRQRGAPPRGQRQPWPSAGRVSSRGGARLEGGAANLGAVQLATECAALETLARQRPGPLREQLPEGREGGRQGQLRAPQAGASAMFVETPPAAVRDLPEPPSSGRLRRPGTPAIPRRSACRSACDPADPPAIPAARETPRRPGNGKDFDSARGRLYGGFRLRLLLQLGGLRLPAGRPEQLSHSPRALAGDPAARFQGLLSAWAALPGAPALRRGRAAAPARSRDRREGPETGAAGSPASARGLCEAAPGDRPGGAGRRAGAAAKAKPP